MNSAFFRKLYSKGYHYLVFTVTEKCAGSKYFILGFIFRD